MIKSFGGSPWGERGVGVGLMNKDCAIAHFVEIRQFSVMRGFKKEPDITEAYLLATFGSRIVITFEVGHLAKKILVVDDELNVRHMLKEYLLEHGFEVASASNGREALFAARDFCPDLILLDVMMPELDGIEFMRIHRQENKTPIILLTARVEETDKVIGLELGADDYVTKPFGMRELIARIKAVLRRVEAVEPGVDIVLNAGGIELDKGKYKVIVEGKEVKLTPTEFELLATMMGKPGRVYSRAQLLEKLHNIAVEGVERTVDVHVRNLRAKIEPDSSNPIYIQTVFGAGYRFADDGYSTE